MTEGADPAENTTGPAVADESEPGAEADRMLREHAALAEDDPRRGELREALVAEYRPVVARIARRFAHRGQSDEDLQQVAALGLVSAINRFDPDRGSDFLSFAVPTMMGEVRRHFRDRGWAVRVPRRLQVLHKSVNDAVSELSQQLGNAPTARQIAERIDVDIGEVREALEAGNAYRAASLDSPLSQDEEALSLGDALGEDDPGIEHVERHEALRPLLAELDERERTIVSLRFFRNMTQTQIAQQVGISQMHVSRLLTRTLAQLRRRLGED